MKIKDLPTHSNLQTIKVRLPEVVYKSSSLPMYEIKTRDVFLMGWMMGDFFVKTNKKSNQIYPMFWNTIPADIDDWEVVTTKKKKYE